MHACPSSVMAMPWFTLELAGNPAVASYTRRIPVAEYLNPPLNASLAATASVVANAASPLVMYACPAIEAAPGESAIACVVSVARPVLSRMKLRSMRYALDTRPAINALLVHLPHVVYRQR